MLPPDDLSFDHWSLALESDIRELRINSLKRQLEASQLLCASLTTELRVACLTPLQKEALTDRWDNALRESRNLQLELDLLQGQQTLEGQEAEMRLATSTAAD